MSNEATPEGVGRPWSVRPGHGPIVAVALHDGHQMRPELARLTVLHPSARMREEDPGTGIWAKVVPCRVVVHRSRFELDMNRPRELAMYRRPEHAWGLKVWKEKLPAEVVDESLALYDQFYADVKQLLDQVAAREGRFVVLDLHSYNHRREGPLGPFAPQSKNPEINLGTGSLNRACWGSLVDRVLETIRDWDHLGRRLDARENIKFQGGEFSRWVHRTYPGVGCALAIEVKKFFMDEWTGALDPALHMELRNLLEAVAQAAAEWLEETRERSL